MASVKGAIAAIFAANTGVTNYTGTGPTARIYANNIPENLNLGSTSNKGTLIFKIIDGESIEAHDGGAQLGWKEIQVDALAYRSEDAESLADFARLAIQAYHHGGTIGGVVIQGVEALQGVEDFFEATQKVYRYSRSYKVWHTEA